MGPVTQKRCLVRSKIKSDLTDYRDAIRHIVDETRNGMDEGLTIDELAHKVKLPDHLAEKPHLREYYGRVDFSVRAYFVGTMGWFDGNPTSLAPLAPKNEAVRFIDMAGGVRLSWHLRKRRSQTVTFNGASACRSLVERGL